MTKAVNKAVKIVTVQVQLALIAGLVILLGGCFGSARAAALAVPQFEVDPFWPKPLPHHWVLGPTVGVAVDSKDHIWIIHRPGKVEEEFKAAAFSPPRASCCIPAPPVLEFDPAGNLLKAWGGPSAGYDWPDSEHGIMVDYQDNVWIGGNGPGDTTLLKFTVDGGFLLQIGKKGIHGGDDDPHSLWRPASMFVDKVTNELYVADGYGNHRVIVFDASTGAYKRHWGAYGTHEFAPAAGPDALSSAPDPAGIQLGIETAGARPKQFNIVHCAVLSNDRLLYVCDRANNRIQVFTAGGTYLKEQRYAPETARSGSVWGIAFSSDPAQAFLYVADGANEVVNLVRRDTLQQVGSFGDGGRQPGEFFGVHNIATDAKGNIYTTETYTGARLQRFLFKRVAPARAAGVAATWPPG